MSPVGSWGARIFQAEGTDNAKALGQRHTQVFTGQQQRQRDTSPGARETTVVLSLELCLTKMRMLKS